MIDMELQKRHYRRYLAHILAVLALLVYLVSANFIFCCLLTVDGEAHIHGMDIPGETGDVKYWIDTVEKQKIDWKNIILIRGWAFIEGENANNGSKYIVLCGDDEKYIFDTNMELRTGVTQHFESTQLDLAESGFCSIIPLERISDGRYQVGIVISKHDVGRTSYIRTNTYVVKKGINVEWKKI